MSAIDEASPICRGKNLSWETVMLFYNYMPKSPMPKDLFNQYVEEHINSWTQTHSQIARQLAFYYEEDGICYPRFTTKSTLVDLFSYMEHWGYNYFVPNPYAPSLKGLKPTSIYAHVAKCINQGFENFDDALDSMFDKKLSSHDKVRVYLANYTNIMFEGESAKINPTIKEYPHVLIPTEEAAADSKAYFDYYNLDKAVSFQAQPFNIESSSNIQSYLTAIRTKPFLLLAGISGTGKSRIVRKLAQATDDIDIFANTEDRWKLHSPINFELIQVKPNWHNSMDVVGFKSNIGNNGEHYEYTPFVEFIAKAWKQEDTPFFLCLDEMNLAPVEEYFAEFLSAIESRSDDGGTYETDPIIKPFRDFGLKVARDMIDHLLGETLVSLEEEDIEALSPLAKRFVTKGMTLPKNLIVMGTVNMDETTFSFSRKVLDRAMSIEMNDVNYDDFLSGKTEKDIPILTEANSLLVDRPIKSQEVSSFVDAESIISYLKAVNDILEGTPFKLGYRAANEAILYVAAAKSFKNDNIIAALDDFTLMKILSRIEGDDTKLKTSANDAELGDDLLYHLKKLFESIFAGLEKCKSLEKLNQMINVLERDHFVSFWG